jgi:hypothetical protein
VRDQASSPQRAAEEGFCTGAVPFVPQQNIDNLAVLIAA